MIGTAGRQTPGSCPFPKGRASGACRPARPGGGPPGDSPAGLELPPTSLRRASSLPPAHSRWESCHDVPHGCPLAGSSPPPVDPATTSPAAGGPMAAGERQRSLRGLRDKQRVHRFGFDDGNNGAQPGRWWRSGADGRPCRRVWRHAGSVAGILEHLEYGFRTTEQTHGAGERASCRHGHAR